MKNRLKLNDKLDNRYANGAGKYQQEQYQKRIEAYNLNPRHCLHCSQAIVYRDFVSNRGKSKFCSRSCSATFNNNQRKQNRPPTLKKKNIQALCVKKYQNMFMHLLWCRI